MLKYDRSSNSKEAPRRGVAATETAVALPVLVLLVFGSIELANGIYLKQALTVAAYEGVRQATRPGATAVEAEARAAEVLAVREVPNFQIQISPAVVPQTERGTEVTVTVTAPGSGFSMGLLPLFDGLPLQGEASMVRQ